MSEPPLLLSVVIPALNEERFIRAAVETVASALATRGLAFELIVVDDGSTDGTSDIVRALERPDLRLVTLPTNRGKGFAVRQGLELARGSHALVIDADLSAPIESIDAFLPHIRVGVDLVIASRRHPGARVERPQRAVRSGGGRGFTWLCNRLLGLGVSDVTCGMRCLRMSTLAPVIADLRIDRWAYDAELLCLARERALTLREVPITWRDRPASRVRLLRDVPGSAWELARIVRARRAPSRPRGR